MMIHWKRHRTIMSILRAFFGGDPREFVAQDGAGQDLDIASTIRNEGMWAFVETKRKPPLVHWWHDGKRSTKELAHLLGHEVGHITGKPLKSGMSEELRADEYGRVAALVVQKLSGLGQR